MIDAAAGHEQHVRRRTVGESVISPDFLAEDGVDRVGVFGNGEDSESCLPKCFPGSGIVDNLRAIEQQHGYGRWWHFLVD